MIHLLKNQDTSHNIDLTNSEQANIEQKILHDQIDILYKNVPISIIISTLLSILIFYKLYHLIHHTLIFGWFISVIIIAIYRLSMYTYFHNISQYTKKHLNFFIVGTALSAILWGIAGTLLMPPRNDMSQMIIIAIIAGVTAGGIQTLKASLTASLVYITLIIVPLCIWLFLQGTSYLILAISMCLYLCFMILSILRENRLFIQALRLGYHNSNLVEKLTLTVDALRKHECEMSMLNKLNEMLQSCQNTHEAYLVIDAIKKQIFSQSITSALAIYNKSTKNLDVILQDKNYPNITNTFDPNDCWALREGHIYLNNDPNNGLICKHFKSTPSGGFICIPLIVRNEIIGLLSQCAVKNAVITKNQSDIAIMFSEVIKLSIANIRLYESLIELSIRDPLTGLFNRRYLDSTLTRELQRAIREKNTICVSMIDIDFFKRFNDQYGHEAGDEVLKMIGKTLLDEFRETDIPCRFGGEEFLVILLNTDLSNVISKLQIVSKKINDMRLYFKGNKLPSVTISIGVAVAPVHGKTLDEIISSVDIALYTAKQNGRNRIEIFKPT